MPRLTSSRDRNSWKIGIGLLIALLAGPVQLRGQDTPEAIPETGVGSPDLAPLDDLMRSFLSDHRIPGAALAVAKEGRLVYARGFGYADREQREPVDATALFRIASISKPITAVAILQLVEQHRINLDDRVVDLLEHQPFLPPGSTRDPRLEAITVRQVLQHRAGWDRAISIDPMFHPIRIATRLGVTPPAGPDDIVRLMLGRPLDFDPGARYAYSNFGYCLLGRLIERVGGTSYEQHVCQQLLAPLGIRRMRIGKTLAVERAEGEVRYYTSGRRGRAVVGPEVGQRVPQPYGAWYQEALDAHGGWIASAVDLVRFGTCVLPAPPTPLLSPQGRAAVVARPPGAAGHAADGSPLPSYYGLGWSVRPRGAEGSYNLWHMGQLPGTSSLLVVRHDGLIWAVLFNASPTIDGKAPAARIDPLMHEAVARIRHWPETDLFPTLLPPP